MALFGSTGPWRRLLRAAVVMTLVCVAAACGGGADEAGDAREDVAGGRAGGGGPDPAQQFTEFATTMEAAAGAPLEPGTIAEGLRLMAGALGAAGSAPPELLVDLRVAAEHVVLNPDSGDVTATVRDALLKAADALPEEAASPDGATARQAAEMIDAGAPLSGQGPALRSFFQRAGRAVAQAS